MSLDLSPKVQQSRVAKMRLHFPFSGTQNILLINYKCTLSLYTRCSPKIFFQNNAPDNHYYSINIDTGIKPYLYSLI